jgi:glycine dehydrogenase
VIQRNILENPAWYTAYTPYQPEISQGRLEALVNFQTLITDLTGLDLANASMLDEGTAAAEAMTMARRAVRSASNRFFVDSGVHPQTLAVIATRAEPVGIELVVGDPAVDLDATDVFGAVLALPTSTGAVVDPRPAIDALRSAGAFSIVVADLLGLCLIEAPGAVGRRCGGRLGAALRRADRVRRPARGVSRLTADRVHRRAMPGRLVGVSRDAARSAGLPAGAPDA